MNASATALTREGEVQSKILKVRNFSRTARVVCAAVFGFTLVGGVAMWLIALLGREVHFTGAGMAAAQLNTSQKMIWAMPIVVVVTTIALATIYQLYRLFGSLAAGSIYTAENVRRVRQVGLLWLLMAVLGVVIPAASAVLVSIGVAVPIQSALVFSWSDSVNSFVAAGIVLLVSWIMDVGLYEKDHADTLQRDADLVI